MCPDEGHTLAPIRRPTVDSFATWTGFVLIVAGCSRISITVALLVAGVLLFTAGSMAGRARQ